MKNREINIGEERPCGLRRYLSSLGNRNSVFWRLSVAMLVFFLIMTVCVTVWIHGIVTGNHREQMGHAALARLEAVSGTVDQALQDIVLAEGQLSWDEDFIRYMAIPFYYEEGTTEARTRDYRILNRLKTVVDSSPLVRRAMLYSPLSGQLYQDSIYSVLDAQTTRDWKLLRPDLDETAVTPLPADPRLHIRSFLYVDGKGCYVVSKLDIGNHIGTLAFELDPAGWVEFLKGENREMMLYMYDKAGKPLLSEDGDYPLEDVSGDSGEYVTMENVEARKIFGDSKFYRYESKLTGWSYISPVDQISLRIRMSDLLVSFLPMLALILLFGLVATRYIRTEIYRPINNLMNQLGGHAGRQENEFDYLENAYSDAREQQKQLTAVLNQVTPQVQESIIRGILFGRQNDPEVVRETLEGIGSPVTVKGYFTVCLCALQKKDERPVSRKEWSLYYVSLQTIAAGLSNDHYQVTAVRVDEEHMALALCFREGSQPAEVHRALEELKETLNCQIVDMPYTLMLEDGPICTEVTGLRDSLLDAMDRIRYQRYMQADDAENGAASEDPTPDMNKQREFALRERCRELVQLASVEEKNKACDAAIQVVENCAEECSTVEELIDACGCFINELVEQLIKYPLSEEDHEKMARYSQEDILHSCTEKDQVRRYVTSRSVEIMQMICSYARKNRNKYVNQAREYIATNYSDSNLSLNDVAEYCGISASYLSELFNEVAGEKFTSYLANYRIEKAQQLQNATRLTVKEIGFQCGFNSSQNFIRVYKKCTE